MYNLCDIEDIIDSYMDAYCLFILRSDGWGNNPMWSTWVDDVPYDSVAMDIWEDYIEKSEYLNG